MKKLGIGALVGGLILFIWQFISWGLLDLHYSQMAYTPAQDEIMQALESSDITTGEYYMIRAPKGSDMEQQEQLMEERTGKPWALIKYRDSLNNNMGMNFIRALAVNIVACFILAWILMNFADLSMKTSILTSIGIGMMGYFTVTYLDSIWFESKTLPHLLDAILSWALVGGWLGWWLRR